MFNSKSVALLMGACLFGLIACAPPASNVNTNTGSPVNQPSNQPLNGIIWIATHLNDQLVVPDTTISLQFTADGKVSGSGGCNSYSTAYTLNGGKLTIKPEIVATRRACQGLIGAQETRYFELLPQTTAYDIVGNQLTLKDNGGKAIARFAIQLQSLAGTAWQVQAYNNGKQAVTSIILNSTLTLEFSTDGKLSGAGGCNNFSGSYTAEGNKLSIGAIGATKKACLEPNGVMEQESQYFAALGTTATYTIMGKLLTLRTADGAVAATLVQTR